jgi:prepilin-type processing-associated H-X9-DG protein
MTLVELLVVISIVGILLALVLPAIHRVREQANQSKCAAQLRQLAVALASYANDNGDWLPVWSGWHVYPPGSPGDDPGKAWTEQLTPYFVPPDSPAYDCPSFGVPWITYFISGRWAASQGRHSTRLTELRLAGQFVLAGETTNRHLYAPPYGDAVGRTTNDCDQDDAQALCSAFPGDSGGFLEHPGGNNILFGDLHVATFQSFDPASMTFDPHVMRAWLDVKPPP